MADIFDEINEDLKSEQMQELWSRYGKYIIIAFSLVVIGVGARQGYTAWQDRQATEAATIYHQALKADDTASALAAKLDKLSPGYAMLSQFRIAATQAETKDFAAAEVSYLALSKDPDVKPLYQQAAILLSVMNAPASRKHHVLAARLTDLQSQAGPWQSMALEQAAGLALRSGDRKTAMAKYESLASLSDIPAGVRQRARQMLQILKG
jgi:hypothetical protein